MYNYEADLLDEGVCLMCDRDAVDYRLNLKVHFVGRKLIMDFGYLYVCT